MSLCALCVTVILVLGGKKKKKKKKGRGNTLSPEVKAAILFYFILSAWTYDLKIGKR